MICLPSDSISSFSLYFRWVGLLFFWCRFCFAYLSPRLSSVASISLLFSNLAIVFKFFLPFFFLSLPTCLPFLVLPFSCPATPALVCLEHVRGSTAVDCTEVIAGFFSLSLCLNHFSFSQVTVYTLHACVCVCFHCFLLSLSCCISSSYSDRLSLRNLDPAHVVFWSFCCCLDSIQ